MTCWVLSVAFASNVDIESEKVKCIIRNASIQNERITYKLKGLRVVKIYPLRDTTPD